MNCKQSLIIRQSGLVFQIGRIQLNESNGVLQVDFGKEMISRIWNVYKVRSRTYEILCDVIDKRKDSGSKCVLYQVDFADSVLMKQLVDVSNIFDSSTKSFVIFNSFVLAQIEDSWRLFYLKNSKYFPSLFEKTQVLDITSFSGSWCLEWCLVKCKCDPMSESSWFLFSSRSFREYFNEKSELSFSDSIVNGILEKLSGNWKKVIPYDVQEHRSNPNAISFSVFFIQESSDMNQPIIGIFDSTRMETIASRSLLLHQPIYDIKIVEANMGSVALLGFGLNVLMINLTDLSITFELCGVGGWFAINTISEPQIVLLPTTLCSQLNWNTSCDITFSQYPKESVSLEESMPEISAAVNECVKKKVILARIAWTIRFPTQIFRWKKSSWQDVGRCVVLEKSSSMELITDRNKGSMIGIKRSNSSNSNSNSSNSSNNSSREMNPSNVIMSDAQRQFQDHQRQGLAKALEDLYQLLSHKCRTLETQQTLLQRVIRSSRVSMDGVHDANDGKENQFAFEKFHDSFDGLGCQQSLVSILSGNKEDACPVIPVPYDEKDGEIGNRKPSKIASSTIVRSEKSNYSPLILRDVVYHWEFSSSSVPPMLRIRGLVINQSSFPCANVSLECIPGGDDDIHGSRLGQGSSSSHPWLPSNIGMIGGNSKAKRNSMIQSCDKIHLLWPGESAIIVADIQCSMVGHDVIPCHHGSQLFWLIRCVYDSLVIPKDLQSFDTELLQSNAAYVEFMAYLKSDPVKLYVEIQMHRIDVKSNVSTPFIVWNDSNRFGMMKYAQEQQQSGFSDHLKVELDNSMDPRRMLHRDVELTVWENQRNGGYLIATPCLNEEDSQSVMDSFLVKVKESGWNGRTKEASSMVPYYCNVGLQKESSISHSNNINNSDNDSDNSSNNDRDSWCWTTDCCWMREFLHQSKLWRITPKLSIPEKPKIDHSSTSSSSSTSGSTSSCSSILGLPFYKVNSATLCFSHPKLLKAIHHNLCVSHLVKQWEEFLVCHPLENEEILMELLHFCRVFISYIVEELTLSIPFYSRYYRRNKSLSGVSRDSTKVELRVNHVVQGSFDELYPLIEQMAVVDRCACALFARLEGL